MELQAEKDEALHNANLEKEELVATYEAEKQELQEDIEAMNQVRNAIKFFVGYCEYNIIRGGIVLCFLCFETPYSHCFCQCPCGAHTVYCRSSVVVIVHSVFVDRVR